METYNILSQVQSELKDFFTKKIKIGSNIIDGVEQGGYDYSQYELLQNIEFMDGSKFLTTDRDSEGQQKFYLNIATFRREVASKNIDIDVKNFLFIPEESASDNGVIIARRKFRKWAKENGLSNKLNDTVDRFPKYGTVVMKKIGKEIEIVPLGKLRNQQDAKSLEEASYVIIEHANQSKHELEEKKGWDLSSLDLKWNDTVTIYERYGYVPKSLLDPKSHQVNIKEDDTPVYAMCIVALDKTKNKDGGLLFIEETECPFVEEHYSRQDGRWLGVGEMEKQIQNQAARNMVFNLRKKSLAWSSKNLYGSIDDLVAQNLVRDVKDGDVIKMTSINGLFRIDTTNRANVDYNSVDQLIEENANQRSFTFEVATGESLPSGTPFRLGAILGNSVNSYYDKKREQLGIFWKNIINEFMLDSWMKDTEDEFIEGISDTEEGFNELRNAKKDWALTQMIIKAVLSGEPVNIEQMKQQIDEKFKRISRDYFRMTKEELKNLKYSFDIDVTGESVDIPKKMETLTNLYQVQLKSGQIEQANETLNKIMILANEKLPQTNKGVVQVPQVQTPTVMPNSTLTGQSGITPDMTQVLSQ